MLRVSSSDLDPKDSKSTRRPRLIDVGKHVLYFRPNAQYEYSQPEPCVGILNVR